VLPVKPIPDLTADLYYLGLDRNNARFDVGRAHELRHTIGSRLWGGTKPWDYNNELVLQMGSFGRRDILAWMAASDTGYTFTEAPLTPRLGFKANIASGNRSPNSGTLGTFNGLFPRNAYFTPAGIVTLTNLMNLYPSVAIRPTAATDLSLGWDFLWRQSTQGCVLSRRAHSAHSRQFEQRPHCRQRGRSRGRLAARPPYTDCRLLRAFLRRALRHQRRRQGRRLRLGVGQL